MSRPAPFDATAPLEPGTTVLEASAGTGKTYTIASLVVRLVAAEGVPLDRILVVTFTEAATAELRDRIRARLAAARAAFVDRDARGDALLERLMEDRKVVEAAPARLEAALSGFDEATIATIHGFCHRVLSEQAFESGVTYDTELLTDLRPLLADVAQDVWTEETVDASPAWLARLSKVSLDDLERLAQLVCRSPDAPVVPDGPSWADVRERWTAVVGAIRGLGAEEHAKALAGLQAAVDGGGMHAGHFVPGFAERRASLEAWLSGPGSPSFDQPPEAGRFGQAYIASKTKAAWRKSPGVPSHPL
ncbi:MAG: UvrD-helicase domain-containing protein, partial [Planctomycetota bacterium JB042]